MELDELKNIWKNKTGFQVKNETQLAFMLKGNSTSVVDKLKRSAWFELILTLVAGVVFLVYAFELPSGALKWTTVSILILFFVYTFYYIKKLLLLRAFKPDDNLKANLEKLVENLEGYLRFYKLSYAILYPVYFGLGLLFGAIQIGSERFFEKVSDPKWILYLIGVAFLFFLLSIPFSRWYLKKLYGNHLQKLRSLLQDINSGDDTVIAR